MNKQVAVFLPFVLAISLGSAFGGAQKIRSEFDKDDWWAQRAALLHSNYQFTLVATDPSLQNPHTDGWASKIITPNSMAPDLYWRTDGASGQAWTGANWSNPASATGGTNWKSGDDAFFTANSTVFYLGGTPFTDVTLGSGITVTVTLNGTAPAATHAYDIGTGATLNWASQSFTAAGTSFTKNGLGTWNLGAISSGYTGGFTLNDGTVIVSGQNSFGAGVLNINGGSILSSGSSAVFFNATSLVIGGNFALGTSSGSGTEIWTATVDLGFATRTITNTASAGRIFSGSISNGGLIFAGTGTTILSGSNSYSDGTTLSGGTLKLNDGTASGTLGSVSGTLTINGGTLDLTGTNQTIGNLTGTGGTILNNSNSSSVTLTIGTGNGTGGNYRGTIVNHSFGSGTVSLAKSGTGTITLSGANTYSGTTTINGGTLALDSAGSITPRLTATSTITVNHGGTLLLTSSSVTVSTDRIGNSATITLAGGTFNLGGRSEGAAGTTGIGALTLMATSTLDFGPAGTNNMIQFAGLGTHTAGAILQILDWDGTSGMANGPDRLLFAGSPSTFVNAFAQGEVTFNGAAGYGVMDFSGYYEVYGITEAPEPSTWMAAALAVAVIGYQVVRRRRAVIGESVNHKSLTSDL